MTNLQHIMDFGNFGGNRKTKKTKKTKSPTSRARTTHHITTHQLVEKGTIHQRQQEQLHLGTNGTRDIFAQLDLTAEASDRLEAAEIADEKHRFQHFQNQWELELEDYDDELDAWQNEMLVGPPMADCSESYEAIQSSFLDRLGWFAECDQCGENDAGTTSCDCHCFVWNVPHCSWVALAGSNEMVPTTFVVPIAQLVMN